MTTSGSARGAVIPAPVYFIGLMSGTSLDGIDAVLVHFSTKMEVLAQYHQPFTASLRQQLFELTHPGDNEIERAAQAEYQLTRAYAQATTQLLQNSADTAPHPDAGKLTVLPQDVRALGAHGQTVRHRPTTVDKHGFSLQLLDPARLAHATHIDVVADFRRGDIALGGQGAPLVPPFHRAAFAHPMRSRAIINLGGIANISWLTATDVSNYNPVVNTGYDIGPANTLLDRWYAKFNPGEFDHNGAWAADGQADAGLLAHLLTDAYFSAPQPKSTGPEYFNLNWLEQQLKHTDSQHKLTPVDVQATLVELSAHTIAAAISNQIKSEQAYFATQSVPRPISSAEVFLCGGGVKNTFLVQQIRRQLNAMVSNTAPVKVESTTALGIDPDFVEAIAFAWLAYCRCSGIAVNTPPTTGATRASQLGGLYTHR